MKDILLFFRPRAKKAFSTGYGKPPGKKIVFDPASRDSREQAFEELICEAI